MPGTRICPCRRRSFSDSDWKAPIRSPSSPKRGIDLRVVLHGTQTFTYHALAYVGDELTMTSRITDVYAKKGGLLEFIVRVGEVRKADGTHVADAESVTIVQNRPPAGAQV